MSEVDSNQSLNAGGYSWCELRSQGDREFNVFQEGVGVLNMGFWHWEFQSRREY